MNTEIDPLEITAGDGLSLFGDSVDNIEFVIESEDEPEDCDLGTKENPIVIHVTNLNEQEKALSSRQVSTTIHNNRYSEEVNLDISELEVKEEIKIEEEEIQMVSNEESEVELIEDEGLIEIKSISTEGKKPNPRCFVPNCTVNEKDEDTIHWFMAPIDKNSRKVWDICIDRPDGRLSSNDVICHQHFSSDDIIYNVNGNDGVVKAVLKEGAVPCISFHKTCCVPNCKSKTGLMYNFPVLRTSNFDLWMYMIRNPNLKKMKMKEVLRHRVCAQHFEPDCFEKDLTLKSTAAPTLFLPEHTINQLTLKSVPKPSPFAMRNARLCCAYGKCTNINLMGKKLFKFPQSPQMCIAWLTACSREGLITSPKETVDRMASGKLGVCEDHFEKHCFDSSGNLKSDAIPKTATGFASDSIRKSIAFSKDEPESSGSTNTKEPFFINEEGTKIMPSAFIGICSYRHCNSKVSETNPFFSFPVDAVRSEKWLKACGLIMSSPSARYQILKNQRICSKHFDDEMFESKYKLKPEAVPRPFVKEKSETLPTNKEVKKTGQREVDPSKIIYCAVSTCPNNYGLTHGKGKFPDPSEDPERFNIWVKLVANAALKDLSPQEIYERYMVCLRHFEPRFYMRDGKVCTLNKDAVPTKFLTSDISWFESSDYYITKLQKNPAKSGYQKVRLVQRQEIEHLISGDVNTTCVLEESGIRFPSTGQCLYGEKRPDSKRKFPYEVYKFFKGGYGLSQEVTVGENIKIHTAIIIDDDDECERQVLQQLLDKRRKF